MQRNYSAQTALQLIDAPGHSGRSSLFDGNSQEPPQAARNIHGVNGEIIHVSILAPLRGEHDLRASITGMPAIRLFVAPQLYYGMLATDISFVVVVAFIHAVVRLLMSAIVIAYDLVAALCVFLRTCGALCWPSPSNRSILAT
jgi:hypothetical protein